MSDQKLIAAIDNLNVQIAELVVATQRVADLLGRLPMHYVGDKDKHAVLVKIAQ